MRQLITTKAKFYELAELGLCGNTPKTWSSIKDYWPLHKNFPKIGLRIKSIGSPKFTGILLAENLKQYLIDNNIREGEYIISCRPSNETINNTPGFQGELSWINGSWYLYYAYKRGYQRDILKQYGEHAFGWRAINLIKQYCSPTDVQDILDLFDYYTIDGNYPIIEFAVIGNDNNFGILQGKNTIIWEIRHF